MSTPYEPRLIVGCYLEDINPLACLNNDTGEWMAETLIKYLEDTYGMLYCEDQDWIGFEVDETLNIDLKTAMTLQDKAQYFKKITGCEAKLSACVYVY